ncbi:tRNA (adenosine(37)-N6)-dimethylallyltransferase MiaA [Colwellia sp. 6M3]|jgi:tRNA dimethylallyltransferase|uniref:tRNA (adenosine(37)-N6)-dimethylallyltransferase MiaA n=1 Tax=Colwellia sp. 6M3 TaxID=2759849 RepID=UPI0015F5F99D|nr:tRNA (adenosine(37)-N6)-dimethylallyltransferase MiaA [Colwellia sp. 6M3]MBA6415159.1 tRNA (adenosine(37)-N6)-dimethylallyltransferase MiaA [Colwellia sp. 6M3]|tara:strand:- start:232 stop:1143 length:912 start_codon:yes stop_codon:yes gene_type:complete
MSAFNMLVVLGSTASGKTKLAVELARMLNGEVISADSRQVYRGLDIGSGKDLDEYQEIKHHLIDIVDPGYEYNIFDFQQDVINTYEKISNKNKLTIMAGGSALYVDSILKGYRLIEVPENKTLRATLDKLSHEQLTEQLLQLKPNLHNTTDLIERDRLVRAIEIALGEQAAKNTKNDFPEFKSIIFAIKWPREVIRERITLRLKQRMEQGLIEEVEQLHAQGVSWETLYFYGLEYRYIAQHLQGQLSKNDCFQKLNSAIHQFSKKQDTWLRRLERNGAKIHWLEGDKDVLAQAMSVIAKINNP